MPASIRTLAGMIYYLYTLRPRGLKVVALAQGLS